MKCVCPRGIKGLSFTRFVHVALTQDHQSPSLLSRDLCYFAITTEFNQLNMHSYCIYLIHTTAYQSYNRPSNGFTVSPSRFRCQIRQTRRTFDRNHCHEIPCRGRPSGSAIFGGNRRVASPRRDLKRGRRQGLSPHWHLWENSR